MIKKLFAVLLVCTLTTTVFAQKKAMKKVTLAGIVKDSLTGKSIEYPTIALFSDSMKLIDAVAAGADGKFMIEAPDSANYVVVASFVGYTNATTPVSLDGTRTKVSLGDFLIKEGVQVEEIVVKGVKPLIVNDSEKLTYNFESDPQAQTSSVVDIFRKIPMLSVDGEDNVRLNGETNYKVLVNGKSSGLIVRNFKDVIKSMPASSIKNVEVITNPPAKYDAEGIGGIINIITVRKTNNGYNGSVNLGANTFGGVNGGGYISAQMGKFAISSNLSAGNYRSPKNESFIETRNFNSSRYRNSLTESGGKYNSTYGNFSLEASYEIDSLNLITLSGFGYVGKHKSDNNSLYTAYDDLGLLSRKYTNRLESKNGYGSASGSIDYQRTFNKPDKNLTVSYSLNANPSTSNSISAIEPELDFYRYERHSENEAKGMEHIAQIDYYDPLSKKHQIETGLKYILRQNISDTHVELLDPISGSWVPAPQEVNDLDYNQHIGSFYGGYVFKHKSLTAKGGVRMEYTFNDGLSKSFTGDIKFDNKQFDVVPYVNLSLNLKKGNNLSVFYTQRLNRPDIWFLNPYVNNSDPMNISYGNPGLESVKSNSMYVSYRKSSQKWNLWTSLNGYLTNNNIEQVIFMDANGVKRTTYENIGKTRTVRFSTNYSYRFKERFNLYVSAGVSYSRIISDELGISNDGFSYNGNAGVNVTLWKKSNFNISGGMFGPSVTLQSNGGKPYYYTSMGLSQKFLKDKLSLSVYVKEPFKSWKIQEYNYRTASFESTSRYGSQSTSVQFSVNWRFGKMNVNVKKSRRSSVDDKMSGGASSGGGQ